MPGTKGRSGRKRKTTAQHKSDGSYREDWHGDRADILCNLGTLKKPKELSPLQSGLWEAVVATIPAGVLGNVDTPGMLGLVRWYEIWDRAMRLAEQDPTDTVAMKQAKTAWDSFWRVASEYGIGPTNRARLKVPLDGQQEDDPFQSILSRLSGTN